MTSLLLRVDLTDRPLAERIISAVEKYREKFGVQPNTVCLSPLDLRDVSLVELQERLRLDVRPLKTVFMHNIWVGIVEVKHEFAPTLAPQIV